jgi:hypothetical protein
LFVFQKLITRIAVPFAKQLDNCLELLNTMSNEDF